MLLAIDVGNTQTAIGVYEGSKLCVSRRIATECSLTSDQILIQVHALLNLSDDQDIYIESCIISCVVPKLVQPWKGALEKLAGCSENVHLIKSDLDYGVSIRYDNPKEIGPDRICDAVAAIEKYGYPSIIVDLGTATNIEVIDKGGSFIGGIIAPGLEVSADALFKYASKLSQTDLVIPNHVIGRNTSEAVQSGLAYGEAKRIDGLVELVENELGYKAKVIATGGLHEFIMPVSEKIQYSDKFLTLDGLRIIHDRISV